MHPLIVDVLLYRAQTMDVLDMEPGLRKVIINTDRRMSTTLMVRSSVTCTAVAAPLHASPLNCSSQSVQLPLGAVGREQSCHHFSFGSQLYTQSNHARCRDDVACVRMPGAHGQWRG